MAADTETDNGDITEWRSIVTLVVFIVTNIIVLFPFDIPFYVPQVLVDAFMDGLSGLRIIAPRRPRKANEDADSPIAKNFKKLKIPLNFITAPIIADLFLLAISAIGREEVRAGTIGAEHIHPLDIMVFFITLAYIAISIDASGLIRWLAFKVLQWGGRIGHKLFFYLYAFFFSLGTFIGNDPIILSGTAFLAYMTRVSENIRHPKAWIYSQFAVANISSAILVSSNPTNLVLAGAFKIKFITYTAYMVVPVIVTAIVLFPFLLYVVFADNELIPPSITMYELPVEFRENEPVNPNIPHARGSPDEAAESNAGEDNHQMRLLSLEEIMNPWLDRKGAGFGSLVMATTLVTLLALNAASQSSGELSVFWVTLPAAVIMFSWDVVSGWLRREKTWKIARAGRQRYEEARERRMSVAMAKLPEDGQTCSHTEGLDGPGESPTSDSTDTCGGTLQTIPTVTIRQPSPKLWPQPEPESTLAGQSWTIGSTAIETKEHVAPGDSSSLPKKELMTKFDIEADGDGQDQRPTLVSVSKRAFLRLQETFPTPIAVLIHLPVALIPFAFAMFVLVQALVSKGWVRVFAYGWDHWVNKTSTVGAIGGMGFLSVILCNFAGTNIGTTILLSRVIQQWYQINEDNGSPISNRNFWATVYSMALGVNYGAFSIAFSASLAGLLWRDILERKSIKVAAIDFARVNFPIIAISMGVGCAVLVGEVYIIFDTSPYRQQ